MTHFKSDVCIIGGGSAGLSVAAGAAQLGLATILIERGTMGGECLNIGCVPSKALLAAGKRAHQSASSFIPGVVSMAPKIDFGAVKNGVQGVIDAIAPHDSAERFERLGVRVLRESARFRDAATIEAGGDTITARWFVVATGALPVIPDIPGLDAKRVLTNETIFALREPPRHLVVLGGGPIGIEMALAHRRLGIPVTLIQRGAILPRDEPELVALLRGSLREEGIDIVENAEVVAAEHGADEVRLHVRRGEGAEPMAGSHLLVATGRKPCLGDLGLDAANVGHGPRGIAVDARLRTSVRSIFALGDVVDAPHFTHVAGYHAGIVVRNLAFRLPATVDYAALPRVTYSDPELAHVGLTEAEARRKLGRHAAVEIFDLGKNDRAVAERRPEGAIKVVLGPAGRILGASILAPGAGEMIGLWCLAISRKLTLRAVAGLILPYPTMGEIAKSIASQYYAPKLFNDRTRRVVRMLQWLPRW